MVDDVILGALQIAPAPKQGQRIVRVHVTGTARDNAIESQQ